MKELQLVFKTAANTTRNLSISNPKEGLTKEEASQAAAKIMPVLVSKSGVEIVAFVKAVLTTTTKQELE